MNLLTQVYGSLKWKKSDAFCADKLGIDFEEYRGLKAKILMAKNDLEEEIDVFVLDKLHEQDSSLIDNANAVVEFRENLEDGTAEIKGIACSEPKSPEEIIKILKIDETVWKLSSYWNKQQRDQWLISAQVTKKVKDAPNLLLETLNNFTPPSITIDQSWLNQTFTGSIAGVLSLQDLHFGKEGNQSVVDEFRAAVVNLAVRAYQSHKIEKLVYVLGGDLLNMDTFSGATTKGTPVDNDMRAQDAYNQAFDSLYWSIGTLAQFCQELHVVYMPGNHDRLSSYHMAHALSKCFNGVTNITFDVEYAERKVITYGSNLFAFEHGDISSKNTPLVYATEFPKQWGQTTYRTCYTGHWHRKKTVEYVSENEVHGFAIKNLPSLSKSDYWHYHNKFVGAKRQAVLELHDYNSGKVCEFTYNA